MDIIITKLCRLLGVFLRLLGRNSSLPGKIFLKLAPDSLDKLTSKYKVIIITGTNGKTTTGSIISGIFNEAGTTVSFNSCEAKTLAGVVGFFIKHEGNLIKEFAVVETDYETALECINSFKVDYLLCTNIFPDQLDNDRSTYEIFREIKSKAENLPNMKIVLNGDEPYFGAINGNVIYFGVKDFNLKYNEGRASINVQFCPMCKKKYNYYFYTYSHLGSYNCSRCGYQRPELDYFADNIDIISDDSMSFKMNNSYVIDAAIGGVYNIYNILAAVSVSREIGISVETISNAIKNFKSNFKHTEIVNLEGKEIKLILIKNPVGFNQGLILPTFNNQDKLACFLINDEPLDGRDISWIWDVDFEGSFSDFKRVFISGTRGYDMAIRLRTAGYKSRSIDICNTIDMVFEKLKASDDGNNVYIFATKSAMIKIRRLLAEQQIINCFR